MNLKEMTNEQVIIGLSDALRVEINHLNKPDDRIYALNYRQTMESELLRRLNEADALRKENAVIRADNADLLAKQDAFVFVHNNMASGMDTLRKENEELRKDKERIDFLDDGNYGIDPRNIPGVMINGRRFHCLAGRGDWSSLRDAIDAARLAKESEASHE